MGKRRFNEKGRLQVETIIDNSTVREVKVHKNYLVKIFSRNYYFLQIKLELESGQDNDGYKTTAGDELLVLPSQKRATKVRKTETVTRILSRKQRKRLEKIVEKKKKKENVSTHIKSVKYRILGNLYVYLYIYYFREHHSSKL